MYIEQKRDWIAILVLAGVVGAASVVWANQPAKSPEQQKADDNKYAAQAIEEMHYKKLGEAASNIIETANLTREQDKPTYVVSIARNIADINDSVKIVTVLAQDSRDTFYVKKAEEGIQRAADAKTLTSEQRDALKASAGSLQAKEALLTLGAK